VSKPTIVLVGAGGHAVSCADAIEQEGRFAIAGLVGTATEVGSRVAGYDVLGTDDDLPKLFGEHRHALVTVGQIKTPAPRIRLWEALMRGGWVLPTITSPRAYVSPHSTVGAGTIILHGAVVNAGATIGRNGIVNSQALVEHDVVIGDHCHIATAAVLNGGVRVGTGCFIGSGSIVRHDLAIGDDCLIGMGQSILADCANGTRAPKTERPA
jgi:sugar O-acyltransferase (sialic acid O-acetyltransferase NeuD family)